MSKGIILHLVEEFKCQKCEYNPNEPNGHCKVCGHVFKKHQNIDEVIENAMKLKSGKYFIYHT